MKPKKEDLIREIEQTFGTVIEELGKFNRETLNEIPFEGSWTAGQTLEHIVICSNGIPDENVVQANRSYNQKVPSLKALFLDFDLKLETDPELAPSSPPHDKQLLLKNTSEIKERLKTIANTRNLEEPCLDMELPSFGNLSRYEWLRFILFHTQRHTRQIANIYGCF